MIAAELLRAVAEEHGTPAYAYDLDAVGDRIRRLRAALPPRVEVAYAVKANPQPAVLRALAGLGLGADTASAGELAAVIDAGFDPRRVVMTGPGKRDAELAMAAGLGLRAITVESPGELDRLRAQVVHSLALSASRPAAAARRPVRVMLRAAGSARPGNVIGAGDGRFGMRWSDLVDAARATIDAPELELVGLHRFDASNVLDADELLGGLRRTVELAARLAAEVGVTFELIDLGGGLGIPYQDGEEPLDVGALGAGLAQMLVEMDANPNLAGAGLLIEPGRWVTGPAGAYLTRVVDVKMSDHGRVATVDGGVHLLLRPALIGQPHRIRLIEADAEARRVEPVTIGGPLCTALDVLVRQAPVPALRVGDLLAVLDAGAYGFTESMPFFLSHPAPPEIVICAGGVELARPRVDPDLRRLTQDAAAT